MKGVLLCVAICGVITSTGVDEEIRSRFRDSIKKTSDDAVEAIREGEERVLRMMGEEMTSGGQSKDKKTGRKSSHGKNVKKSPKDSPSALKRAGLIAGLVGVSMCVGYLSVEFVRCVCELRELVRDRRHGAAAGKTGL